jgi:hypothetical protein
MAEPTNTSVFRLTAAIPRASSWTSASPSAAHPHARLALFLVAAAALLLLFIGIHNAWDAVTYHVFVRRRERRDAEQTNKPNA